MVSVMCLTTSGGVPLFNRKYGNIEPFSFSSMASLNGVHMYGKSHNMLLKSTATEDMSIVWKEFENSITIIIAGVTLEEQILNELAEAIYNAMVMFVGIEELRVIKNVERLRKDLRVCYALIEKLLQSVDLTDSLGPNLSLLNFSSMILCEEFELLQNYVDTWSECVASLFCCVVIEGFIASGTSGWWDLDQVDRYLLSMVIPASDSSTSSDVPVFLPMKSPNVPFRLVSCTLMQGVRIVALCGPVPDLYQFEQLAIQAWKSCIDVLNDCASVYPRNISPTFPFHDLVLGFLLMDHSLGRMVMSGSVNGVKKEVKCPNHILRSFYYQTVYDMLLEKDEICKQVETYWCSEHYKTFALIQEDTILCLLFSSSVPTHAMRMDADCLLEYLDYTLTSGITLNFEHQSMVQNSLIVLQDQAKFHRMFFWGVIYGTQKDYFIAFGVRKDALDRVYYYSVNALDWFLLPHPVSRENAFSLSKDCKTRFSGDPMLMIEILDLETKGAQRSDQGENLDEEGMQPNIQINERSLKEEDRLAVTVQLITEEAFVLPRRALFKVPNKIGSVVFNKYFQGLSQAEADLLESYVHYREPRFKWNTNLLKSSAANYSTDFLDCIDADIPKEKSWSLCLNGDKRVSIVKSLFWPGTTCFHVLESQRYGMCYFGYGVKNLDVPFMLSVPSK